MLAVSDIILAQNTNLLRQGAVLVDSNDSGDQPYLLLILTHEIKAGDGSTLSRRLQFVRVDPNGIASFAGWAPHLDLQPLDPAERPRIQPILDAPWLRADLEQKAIAVAVSSLVPEHVHEVTARHIAQVDKTLTAVHERLSKEIAFLSDRWLKLREDQQAGKDVRLNLENARRTLTDLEGRLDKRKAELQRLRHVASSPPVALGGALVIPAGLLKAGCSEEAAVSFSADAEARQRIEKLAMNAVIKAEEARGCSVVDVSREKCGWDLTSFPPPSQGKLSDPRHIEVKGRTQGATTITVTRNEILYALNQADKFILAIVLVNHDDSTDGPFYLHKPFDTEPGWGVSSVNFDLQALLSRAQIA